jgi:hypothetical protein
MKLQRIASARLQPILVAAAIAASLVYPARGQGGGEKPKREIEDLSPDGRLGFLYSESEKDDEKAYDLVEKATGKVLVRVAESPFDEGASSRFSISGVLWKSDLSAFAVTFSYYKRGTVVILFKRTDGEYKEVELPELLADIPDKLTKGKDFHHIYTLNSETAMRWQKNGSLTVQIENAMDGSDGIVTATRTVDLSFDKTEKAKVVKSSIKYATTK